MWHRANQPDRGARTPWVLLVLAAVASGAPAQGERGGTSHESAQTPGVMISAGVDISPGLDSSPGVAALAGADILRGWATLRGFDCARCHGRDLGGWSGPDLVAAVRDGSRERFDHYVLAGDVIRGMPGYRSQAAVVADLDAIYAYLRARAEGRVGPGRPVLPQASTR